MACDKPEARIEQFAVIVNGPGQRVTMGAKMRTMFLGCPIDILTMAETVDLAREAMRSGQRLQHVALNDASWLICPDPVLAADVISSDLVGIDGMGIVLAARLLGLPVKERVTGMIC